MLFSNNIFEKIKEYLFESPMIEYELIYKYYTNKCEKIKIYINNYKEIERIRKYITTENINELYISHSNDM